MLLTLQPWINHLWTGVDRLLARWRKLSPSLKSPFPSCRHKLHQHTTVLWLGAAFFILNSSCGATLCPSSSCYLLSQVLLSQALLSQSSVSFKQDAQTELLQPSSNPNLWAWAVSHPSIRPEMLEQKQCPCGIWTNVQRGFISFLVLFFFFNQCFCLCSCWEGAVPSLGEELGLHTHRSSAGWTNLQVIPKRGELESKANIQGELNKLEVKPSKTSWSAKPADLSPECGPGQPCGSLQGEHWWAGQQKITPGGWWMSTDPSLEPPAWISVSFSLPTSSQQSCLTHTMHYLLFFSQNWSHFMSRKTHTQTSAAALMAPTTQWISGTGRTRKQELLASNPTYYPFSHEDFPWKPCLAWDCCCNVF